METINEKKIRVGNITSSEIVAIMSNGKAAGSFGKPFYEYIKECNWERKLGRSITDESNARPLTWGKLCENIAFAQLGFDYKLTSHDTIQHPTIDYWCGSPDAVKESDAVITVPDLKCPSSLKSFCQLVEPIYQGLTGMDAINYVRENHKDGDKYFWQLISNAILTGAKYAELIVYCPYFSELKQIQELAKEWSIAGKNGFNWIAYANEGELPYLLEGETYNNINIIRWEVAESDKEFLTARVLEAGKYLTPSPTLQNNEE